ncbi:MAG: hypothetical protein Ta2E_10670 [Mycoplasmoidaceae bacterium]|nr:MAG: hypothetical protein Ta2E_10670 [Mycoplasmoidaceae bacterium]
MVKDKETINSNDKIWWPGNRRKRTDILLIHSARRVDVKTIVGEFYIKLQVFAEPRYFDEFNEWTIKLQVLRATTALFPFRSHSPTKITLTDNQEGLSDKVDPATYIRQCISGNVYPAKYIRQCISGKVYPAKYIRQSISGKVYPAKYIRHSRMAMIFWDYYSLKYFIMILWYEYIMIIYQ